jgi:hypothetical protein
MRIVEDVRQNEQPATLFAREPCHRRLDLGIILHWRGSHHDGERSSRFLNGVQ